MVRVPINQWAGFLVYLFAITGISLLGTGLSSLVADQAIGLALPHLDNGPPKLSLVERRRIATTLAIPPPEGARARVITLEAPSMPAHVLAARLDLAEREDVVETASSIHVASATDGSLEPDSQPSSIAARVYDFQSSRTVRSGSRHAAVSTRDIVNRSFGVLSVASNY